jgi:hypothetical protein
MSQLISQETVLCTNVVPRCASAANSSIFSSATASCGATFVIAAIRGSFAPPVMEAAAGTDSTVVSSVGPVSFDVTLPTYSDSFSPSGVAGATSLHESPEGAVQFRPRELVEFLHSSLVTSGHINRRALSIVDGEIAWALRIEAAILETDGSAVYATLLNACSAALTKLVLPESSYGPPEEKRQTHLLRAGDLLRGRVFSAEIHLHGGANRQPSVLASALAQTNAAAPRQLQPVALPSAVIRLVADVTTSPPAPVLIRQVASPALSIAEYQLAIESAVRQCAAIDKKFSGKS